MNIVTTVEGLAEVAAVYRDVDFAFDVETAGDDRLNPLTNRVTWLSLATHGRVDVIPMGHANGSFMHWDKPLLAQGRARLEKGLELRDKDYTQVEAKWIPVFSDPPEQLAPPTVWEALRPAFFNESTMKVAQNAKFDVRSVAKYLGGFPKGDYFDTMIAAFLIEPDAEKGLAPILKRVFRYEMAKGVGKDVTQHCFADVAKYSALDARWTWLLANRLAPRLEELDLFDAFDLEMSTLKVVIDMEQHGVNIDVDRLVPLRDELEAQLNDSRQSVYEAAGREFNLNSNREKQDVLFSPKESGGQGLKVIKTTATGAPSVDADVLERLAKRNKVARALLHYADLSKLLTTYITPYLGGTAERTTNGKTRTVEVPSLLQRGRIHGRFNQIGTETSRFASSGPNLQNVPNASTENGKAIRNLFVPDEGHLMIVSDFGQIEPRIIAHLSGDKRMIAAFHAGEDIYTAVAEPLGVDRAAGKKLVLSIAYGVGPQKIADDLGISVKRAQELLDEFAAEFPAIDRLKKRVIKTVRNTSPPAVRTMYGFRRPIPLINSVDNRERYRGERQAFNSVIQGSAAAIMKRSLVRTYDLLPPGAHIVLTVHDEMVVTAPQEYIETAEKAVREGMVGVQDLKVPLVIDLKIAERWGEGK